LRERYGWRIHVRRLDTDLRWAAAAVM
jgi:hypothetical protein